MQTISIKNSLLLTAAFLAGCLHHSNAAELNHRFTNGAEIKINDEIVDFDLDGANRTKKLSKALNNELSSADEAFVLNRDILYIDGYPHFIAIVRTPSTLYNKEGRCGSGHEDRALLIRIENDNVELKDSILVQSCLKDISIVSDKGDNPRDAISYSSHSKSATFKYMAPPDFKIREKMIVIKNKRLVLIELHSQRQL